MNAPALLFAIGWPFALASGLSSRRLRPVARSLAPWGALPMLVVALGGGGEAELHWLMLGGRLGLDWIATPLLPVTAGLWLAAGLFAQRYLDPGPRRDAFFTWFLAAMCGNLLLLAALDAVVFYLGFALMSFAAYGLVVHEGDRRARHAGRYYIALVVLGEICIISALMLLAHRAPIDFVTLRESFLHPEARHNDLVIGLLLAGFGIKVGIVGLHFWLPLAHPVAPAPASAVLSGAMIKAGLVGWMRLLPLGEMALPAWGAVFATLGLVTAFYGVLAGLPQREAKTVLAYSSVSQMGVMTMAVGLGLAFPGEWPLLAAALLVYVVHHGLVKGGLFLGAGLALHELRPAAARLVAVALALGALALAGGPLTGGLVAKLSLKHAAGLLAAPWGATLPWLLSLSSVFTALLMLRFLQLAWPRTSEAAEPLPRGTWLPWLALLVAWWAGPWLLAEPATRVAALGPYASWSASWPVLLALALALAAARLRRAGRLPALPSVPPGDAGIPLERGVTAAGRRLRHWASEDLPRVRTAAGQLLGAVVRSGPGWALRLEHGEARVALWSVTACLLLLLASVIAWLMA